MKTLEDIVKEKEYFELTDQEREIVSELAHDQEAYDQVKIPFNRERIIL